jgi:hypothetical protein
MNGGSYGNGPAWTPDHLFPIVFPTEEQTGALPESEDDFQGPFELPATYDVQEIADPGAMMVPTYQQYYSEHALHCVEPNLFDPALHHDPCAVGMIAHEDYANGQYVDQGHIYEQEPEDYYIEQAKTDQQVMKFSIQLFPQQPHGFVCLRLVFRCNLVPDCISSMFLPLQNANERLLAAALCESHC